MLWSMPLMIVLALYMLWGTLGPSSMAGLGVLLLLMPINAWAASKQRSYQMQQMKTKDKRIKIMNEILNGIKVGLSKNIFFLNIKILTYILKID